MSVETGKANHSPRFWMDRQLSRSPAYLDLSFSARLVLMYFFGKFDVRKRKGVRKKAIDRLDEYEVVNNGRLIFPYQEAEALGFSTRTFRRALADLQEHGFIRVEKRGYGGVGEFSVPSEYRVLLEEGDWKRGEKPAQGQKQKGTTSPTALKTRAPFTVLTPKPGHGTD